LTVSRWPRPHIYRFAFGTFAPPENLALGAHRVRLTQRAQWKGSEESLLPHRCCEAIRVRASSYVRERSGTHDALHQFLWRSGNVHPNRTIAEGRWPSSSSTTRRYSMGPEPGQGTARPSSFPPGPSARSARAVRSALPGTPRPSPPAVDF